MPVSIPARLTPRFARSFSGLAPGPNVSERTFILTISGVHALTHAIELAYAALLLRIEAEFGTNLLLLGVLSWTWPTRREITPLVASCSPQPVWSMRFRPSAMPNPDS